MLNAPVKRVSHRLKRIETESNRSGSKFNKLNDRCKEGYDFINYGFGKVLNANP